MIAIVNIKISTHWLPGHYTHWLLNNVRTCGLTLLFVLHIKFPCALFNLRKTSLFSKLKENFCINQWQEFSHKSCYITIKSPAITRTLKNILNTLGYIKLYDTLNISGKLTFPDFAPVRLLLKYILVITVCSDEVWCGCERLAGSHVKDTRMCSAECLEICAFKWLAAVRSKWKLIQEKELTTSINHQLGSFANLVIPPVNLLSRHYFSSYFHFHTFTIMYVAKIIHNDITVR